MKIGILTFHYAYNYGAILQAVSLYDYLKSMGHEVFMIDHKNENIVKTYRISTLLSNIDGFKECLLLFPRICLRLIRFNKFKRFIKKNFLIIECNKINSLDCIIVGSDQVWNTSLTNGYDSYYWGCIPFEGYIVSYASSMNSIELSDSDKKNIKEKLMNFKYISVRESSMLNLLSPLTDKIIKLVLDPTMLNDYTYWLKRCNNSKSKSKYILSYPLRDSETVISLSQKIAGEKLCSLKIIRGDSNWNPFSKTFNTAGPSEALSLINNAEIVVTSSFHGTVLSILLQKDFYTIKCKDGNNVRTESVLNLLGLKDRMIETESDIDLSSHIDYRMVNEILMRERKKSQNYLYSILTE